MMSNARERICESALRLFQERGYEKVSLREIAQHAATTIGNLTHHFPRKDCLLAELQERLQTEFPLRREFSPEPEEQLNALIETFFAAERNEREKSFYFQNIARFYEDSEKVRENISSFQAKLFDYYYLSFTYLRDQAVLQAGFSPEACINLAYVYVLITQFWVARSSPYQAIGLPKIPIAEAMTRLLEPHVAEEFRPLYWSIYEKLERESGTEHARST